MARRWRRLPIAVVVALGACRRRLLLPARLAIGKKDDDGSDRTGSIARQPRRPPQPRQPPARRPPSEFDLAYARAAAVRGARARRQGPQRAVGEPADRRARQHHAARRAYNQDGFTCRDFLASYVREGAEAWLQGEACRVHQGKWEVEALRPWKKT